VVLAVDAEYAAAGRCHIPLPGDLGTAEDGVALGIHGLQKAGAAVAAGGEILAAFDAGELPEDEVVVAGVIGLAVEPEFSVHPLEADLGGLGGLDLQAGIADLERARCIVGAV